MNDWVQFVPTIRGRYFPKGVLLLLIALICACSRPPIRSSSSVESGENLLDLPQNIFADVDCDQPIVDEWPRVFVYVPENKRLQGKLIRPKTIEVQINDKDGVSQKNLTILRGQTHASIGLGSLKKNGPLEIQLTQVFYWRQGKRKHLVKNTFYKGAIDKKILCVELPKYKAVTAKIQLSPRYLANLRKRKLSLKKGYISLTSQMGDLSLGIKLKKPSGSFN